jgi:cell division GTPase FtsZ
VKLVVVGIGQCGGRIADEFARLNSKASIKRGLDIITGCFAVNTDASDLLGLTSIGRDHHHRILIGGRKTNGHGVGKVNELGAEIAREDADKIIDNMRSIKKFYETDAFLLIAGTAGGTGSGAISVITQYLKERYFDKPVWNLCILPFEHEESTEERTVFNVATCLKSCYSVADAVFLADNQRYVRKDASIQSNLIKINSMIVSPFYNILCAGEEKQVKHIGSKLLDAGDIIQTVVGWSTIGYGKTITPSFQMPKFGDDFRSKGNDIQKGIRAMDEAISELSIKCNPADARRALFLVTGPPKDVNMDMIKEIGDYMRDIAPEAIIRNGDYPRDSGLVDVTILFSELSSIEKVRNYYVRSSNLIPEFKRRQEETENRLKDLDDISRDIPSLL